MVKLKKIDSIMFKVKDLEKSAEFYEKEMGLKKVWEDKKEGMIGFIFPESDSEIKKSSEMTLGCSGMRISMSIPEIVIHNNERIPNPDFSFLVDNVDEFLKNFNGKVLMRTEIKKSLSSPHLKRCGLCGTSGCSEKDNCQTIVSSLKAGVYFSDIRSGKLAVLEDLDGNKIPIVDLTKFGNKPRYD